MLTRNLTNPKTGLAAGLLLGLVGQDARAAEEVVVYGNDIVERAMDAEAGVRADREKYLEAFERELKKQRAKELENIRAPEIELAIAEVHTRG